MPISAFFKAGASLTPSPVTATICLISLRALTISILCSGATLAKDHVLRFRQLGLEVVVGHRLNIDAVMMRTALSRRTMPMRRAIASAVRP